jgi:hypothetical protein
MRARLRADAGVREIVRLLTTRDASLEAAARRLAAALPHGVLPAASRTPHLVVDRRVVDAVQQIRRSYRRLHAQMAGIETARGTAKERVLRALDELDSAFGLLLQSLGAHGLVKGARLARQAQTHQTHAAGQLRRAYEELR